MDVAAIMSKNPITIEPSLPVSEARELLDNEDIRHAPVVRDGRLVGVVSDRDLYPTAEELSNVVSGAGPTRTVAQVMHAEFTAVSPEDTVVTAAVDFSIEKIGCLPVLSGSDLVGILSELDMLVAFAQACRDGGLVDPVDQPCASVLMAPETVAVTADTAVSEAILICRDLHARHLPVVEGDRLIGIVSSRDLGRCEAAGRADEDTIASIMQTEPITVGPDDPTPDVAMLMATAKVSALPVVRDGKLVGILTITDLLDHCMNTLREPDGIL